MAYKVEGIIFDDKQEALEASKEAKTVSYIKSQLDMNNHDDLLSMYEMMLDKKMFHTKVGEKFLNEIHDALSKDSDIDMNQFQTKMEIKDFVSNHEVSDLNADAAVPESLEVNTEDDLKGIKQPKVKTSNSKPRKKTKEKKADKNVGQSEKDLPRYKYSESRFKRLKFANTILGAACAVMFIMIVGMLIINRLSNSPQIYNYEEELINKYSAWEEQLQERENALRERESAVEE